MCGKEFFKNSPAHRFCGSDTQKTGCSYDRYLGLVKKFQKENPKKVETYTKKYRESEK